MVNATHGSDHPLPLETPSQVAQLFGLTSRKFNYWFFVLPEDNRYRTFEIKRRSGSGTRTIHAPIRPIKDIQAKLAHLLDQFYKPLPHVHGYITGRSIVSNAYIHKRQRFVLRVDLKEFFPSINFGRVRGIFRSSPFEYTPTVATLLAQICCHDNQLPHGAPTSPLISNFICRSLDRTLAQLARSENCYYSRYCDDLIFSTNRGSFPKALAQTDHQTGAIVVGEQLHELIDNQGFEINPTKTILRHRSQRQMVTGLITNEIVNVPRNYIRSVRNVLYIWKRYCEQDAEARFRPTDLKNRPPIKDPPKFREIIRGKVQYIGSIKGWESSVYKSLSKRLEQLDPSFSPTTSDPEKPTTFRIFAEGKTDYKHLRSAFTASEPGGLGNELDLQFQIHIQEGDSDLLKRCKYLASVAQSPPCVFIFDRDNKSVISEVMDGDNFRNWGNNVFSFALPIPEHRSEDEGLCIELLYKDETLNQKDGAGRRVFQLSEFDSTSGLHHDKTVTLPNAKQKSLIPEEVIDIESGKNIALSKNSFADRISEQMPPYQSVDFQGFRPVFEVILAIRKFIFFDG